MGTINNADEKMFSYISNNIDIDSINQNKEKGEPLKIYGGISFRNPNNRYSGYSGFLGMDEYENIDLTLVREIRDLINSNRRKTESLKEMEEKLRVMQDKLDEMNDLVKQLWDSPGFPGFMKTKKHFENIVQNM